MSKRRAHNIISEILLRHRHPVGLLASSYSSSLALGLKFYFLSREIVSNAICPPNLLKQRLINKERRLDSVPKSSDLELTWSSRQPFLLASFSLPKLRRHKSKIPFLSFVQQALKRDLWVSRFSSELCTLKRNVHQDAEKRTGKGFVSLTNCHR